MLGRLSLVGSSQRDPTLTREIRKPSVSTDPTRQFPTTSSLDPIRPASLRKSLGPTHGPGHDQ